MKKKYKLVKKFDACFDCDGRGERSNYTGCGEDGYEWGKCVSCSGTGGVRRTYESCNSCGHEQLHFSRAAKKFLKSLAP